MSIRNVEYKESEEYEEGLVISQSISEGTEVAMGSSIDLVVSTGKKEEEKEEKEENQVKNVDLRLTINTENDTFNVKIYKLDENKARTDLMYNEDKSKEDLTEEGILNLNFKAILNTNFEVVVDDESYGVYTVN